MGFFSWFSADEDGKVVAKTNVRDNGTVARYEYTEPDDVSKGHGHKEYENMEKFIEDKPYYTRDKYTEKSKNKKWHGEGYTLTIEDLIELKEELNNSKLHTTSELLLKLK